jgi:hypothetical protein
MKSEVKTVCTKAAELETQCADHVKKLGDTATELSDLKLKLQQVRVVLLWFSCNHLGKGGRRKIILYKCISIMQ